MNISQADIIVDILKKIFLEQSQNAESFGHKECTF